MRPRVPYPEGVALSDRSIVKSVGIWIVTALAAAGLGIAGSSKLLSPDMWIARFEGWGYPGGFSYVIGVLETVGALGLLVPRGAAYAALGLAAIMTGAVLTHVVNGQGFLGPVLYLVLLGLIGWSRWAQRWSP